MNPLRALESCGQSPWIDYLKRSFVEKGDLARLVREDGLKGVTSNPSIFQKAIGEGDDYLPAMRDFLKDGDRSVSEVYEHLAVFDIKAAADVLKEVYEATDGRDGYVSLECSPYLANDTEATLKEALHLWEAVDRKNLMVKVPATPAGVPVIRELIARGINVNVTLLFSLEAYEAVAQAYLEGLEARKASGGDIARVASVASFFVSRIDGAVDKRLGALEDPAAKDLAGKVAIANAKMAYVRWGELFKGPRWAALEAAGARPQRILWASTSTKNRSYRDTLYAEALIGPETVDTLPPATLDAFRDHGEVRPGSVLEDIEGARGVLKRLEDLGVSLKEITEDLVADGVRQFADAFDALLGAVAEQRLRILEGEEPRQVLSAPEGGFAKAFEDLQDVWRREGRGRRLWALDPALWTSKDEGRWGGWLSVLGRMRTELPELQAFAGEVAERNFTDVLLLGMGGSSLGPEVIGAALAPGHRRFQILDSTDPNEVRARREAIDIGRTLFIVSSKSGGTLEPNLFLDYFFDEARTALGEAEAGRRFVAVTDPGSSLEKEARARKFWKIFKGEPEIGGRYSVLSNFGLVPAAAMGVDLDRFLAVAARAAYDSGPDAPPPHNPGVRLGLLLGLGASASGRDKVTLLGSPGIGPFAAWLEQLLAESTGKDGKGLIPLAGEPLGGPEVYGADRIFVDLSLDAETNAAHEERLEALVRAGHPLVRIRLETPYDLAGEFFRWEIATAVAGAVIGINPFDQPDVEASKTKTRALMEAYETSHAAPAAPPLLQANGMQVFADAANAKALGAPEDPAAALKAHFARAKAGDYVAFLAYVARTSDHEAALEGARVLVRQATGCATCVGFGPRFQHSTGQAYKGGPASGVFIQITADPGEDLMIPGRGYGFGVVEAAQAAGDLGVLEERGRRVLRLHLADPGQDLGAVADALTRALG